MNLNVSFVNEDIFGDQGQVGIVFGVFGLYLCRNIGSYVGSKYLQVGIGEVMIERDKNVQFDGLC